MFEDFKNLINLLTGTTNRFFIYFTFLCVAITFLLIIAYVIIILKSFVTTPKNKTILNIESIEYASIYSLTFINKGLYSFNYTYFWIISMGVALLLLGYFKLSTKEPNQDVLRFVNIALIALSIALPLQILIMVYAGRFINKVKAQSDALNTLIRINIYKNGEFLKKLRKPKTDINDKYNTIVECIGILKNEKDKYKLAKGFYTLTLYNYFNEFSLKNLDNAQGAYEIFDLLALTEQIMPSAYMPRYGTFIEDIGETIRQHMSSSSSLVNDAMNECDILVSKTNELANTIYPDQAFNVFLLMLVTTILINVLLVCSVYYYGILKTPPKEVIEFAVKHETPKADNSNKTPKAEV